MRNLLSDSEIKAMRKELDVKMSTVPPPANREFWEVGRIVDTLEYFQEIEKKYDKLIKTLS